MRGDPEVVQGANYYRHTLDCAEHHVCRQHPPHLQGVQPGVQARHVAFDRPCKPFDFRAGVAKHAAFLHNCAHKHHNSRTTPVGLAWACVRASVRACR